MAEYRLSKKAESDLRDILTYTVQEFGVTQAENYVSEIEFRLNQLAENPKQIRERNEFTPPVRIAPSGKHMLVFVERDYGILVVRILHQAMDFERHL